MRLTAHVRCARCCCPCCRLTWAQVPTSTQPPAQPRSTTSTRTATKALVSTSTSTSVGRVGTLSKAEIGAAHPEEPAAVQVLLREVAG
jgi:hypothetical protein